MKKIFTYFFVLLLTFLLIINPEKSVIYAKNGLNLCTDIIIPSLFPFFVCSGLLIYSGFCEVIAKLFSPVMKPLFNINPSGAAAFVLGIISGYPLGALTVCQLYNGMYLSKSEAERLLAFSNNSGPLFIMGAVGVSIYHSTKAGVILYIAHIIAAVTVGILSRLYKPSSFTAPRSAITTEEKNMSRIYSSVISNSVNSMLTVCASVLFCSTISGIFLDMINVAEPIKAFISGIVEFSSGLKRISLLDWELVSKLLFSAWVCAFAGISVHLQVMGIVNNSGLSLKPYIVGKILHGLFSVLYTAIMLRFIPVTEMVFSTFTNSKRLGGGFFASSLLSVSAIIILCIFGLLFISSKKKDKTI